MAHWVTTTGRYATFIWECHLKGSKEKRNCNSRTQFAAERRHFLGAHEFETPVVAEVRVVLGDGYRPARLQPWFVGRAAVKATRHLHSLENAWDENNNLEAHDLS